MIEPTIIGRVITGVRKMSKRELNEYGWAESLGRGPALVVELEGGFWLMAMSDEEGNDYGCLTLVDSHGTDYYLLPASA